MKKIVCLIMLTGFVLSFIGCHKDELIIGELPKDITHEEVLFKDGQMILGEKLENPYSVENMQTAYDNLQAGNKLKSEIKIEATHYYVRFRPKSMQELDIITRDTTLDIYDYPLDVEIIRGGTHYHDPSMSSKEITWQYTVVPVDYTFPKIQNQKLAKLYLPEEGGELTKVKSASIEHFDWLKLETEALRITGNLKETGTNDNILKSSSWRPAGTIKVWDDIIDSYSSTRKVFDHYEYYNCESGEAIDDHPIELIRLKSLDIPIDDPDTELCKRAIYRYETNTTNSHFIPLEGIEVRARRWFTTHKGYTNANGNFTCDGTFTRDANYSIKWERWDFDIRDGSYGQAYYNGPKQTGNWNLDIAQSGTPKSFLFAHIFRAAYTYYYKNSQWGIKSPPERDGVFGALGHRLHISGKDKSGTSHYFDFNELWFAGQVVVYSKTSDGNYKNSKNLFGTSIHEMAHASHWELGYEGIEWLIDNTLSESWATGIEAVITNDVYNSTDYNIKQSSRYTIAYMTTGNYKGYTSIVWDLIDDHNQFGTNLAYPDDQVSGYTLSQLEDALSIDPDNWWGWRNNIRDEFNNPTEVHLDKLFHDLQ